MFPRLGAEEIIAFGKELGLGLSPVEARIIQSRMVDQVASMEAFDDLRIEEQRLPLRYGERDPGYRPTAEEDPLNLFIRRCRVAGADQGPLKGKTFGLKDHISLWGYRSVLVHVSWMDISRISTLPS